MGPFLWDKEGNHYLLVAMDLFSKWVDTLAVPSLHSWRAAKFLYDDLVASWGKPHYVQTDNCTEFAGSFTWLCEELGIIQHYLTVGNSKANTQVEQTIRTLKDCIQCDLKKEPASFWTNHLALALLLLYMTVSQMMDVALFLLAMGHQALLPSLAIPGLSSLPDQLTPDEQEAYFAKVSRIVVWL